MASQSALQQNNSIEEYLNKFHTNVTQDDLYSEECT